MGYEKPADYKEVPERIADLKAKHPDARLRPANPEKPFEIVTLGDRTFIVYAAACYRDEDDTLPAIGVAWEPFPGKTPYTKDSELMNAETSAWGRAIVAALRSESKAIASAHEVRNRQADRKVEAKQTPPAKPVAAASSGGKRWTPEEIQRAKEEAAAKKVQAAFPSAGSAGDDGRPF